MGKRAQDLKDIRLEKRLTQAEVAAKLKVSQSYYSSIERGAKPTEISTALKTVATMRKRLDRTAGGADKAGREK
jgi:transcriptional regulator with XRE-family HTH domain